jgi:phospholipid/cholesterol/gamma-HCH transport system substrate-binding protein
VTDYESIQKRRNVIVGIFVLAALCALVWLIKKFDDLPTIVSKISSYEVLLQLPTAPGVQRDTPVRFCGFQIGRVTEVRPPKIMQDLSNHQFYHQTLAILSIDNRYNDIPADVDAKLMTRGLGSSYIELKLKKKFDVNEPMGPVLIKGSKLQGSAGQTSEFFPEESQQKLDELITSIVAFVKNANAIIGDPNNQDNISKILVNLSEASGQATVALKQAAETMQKAREGIEDFRKFVATGTSTLEKADVHVEKLVTALVETSEELSQASSQLRLILEKINSGQGSAARLLNDGQFYENLLENTEQLQEVLDELKTFVAEAREKGVPLRLKK